MSQPSPGQLRALAGLAGVLVLAGALLGWFERSSAAEVGGPVTALRPGELLGLGLAAWLLLAPFVLAPLVARERRGRLVALLAVLPGLALVVAAAAMPPRAAVSGETLDDIVIARTTGQALSLAGALIAVMALGALWRRAPDWRIPFEWSRTATER